MPEDDDIEIPPFLKREGSSSPKKEETDMAKTAKQAATKADTPKPVPDEGSAIKTADKAPNSPAKGRKTKAALDAYGYRQGSLKSRAAAMYAAPDGATLAEVKKAIGSVQLNILTELEKRGITIERKKVDGDGARQVTRYKIVS